MTDSDFGGTIKAISYILVAAAGILWGCIGIFVRGLSAFEFTSMEIVEIRAFVTVLFLFPILLMYKSSLFRIRIKDLWIFAGTGICSILFFNYCYFLAIRLMSLSAAAVLLYTAPAFVMILSFFIFHESFTGRKILSIVLTFLGCLFVSGAGTSESLSFVGILVGLGAGLGYALYSIFGRFAVNRGYSSLTVTFYTFLFALFGTALMQPQAELWQVLIHSPVSIGCSIGLGIICTVLPFLCYTAGLKGMENVQASVIASIEPVVATLIGIFLFHEDWYWNNILGVVLVIVGIAICNVHITAKK